MSEEFERSLIASLQTKINHFACLENKYLDLAQEAKEHKKRWSKRLKVVIEVLRCQDLPLSSDENFIDLTNSNRDSALLEADDSRLLNLLEPEKDDREEEVQQEDCFALSTDSEDSETSIEKVSEIAQACFNLFEILQLKTLAVDFLSQVQGRSPELIQKALEAEEGRLFARVGDGTSWKLLVNPHFNKAETATNPHSSESDPKDKPASNGFVFESKKEEADFYTFENKKEEKKRILEELRGIIVDNLPPRPRSQPRNNSIKSLPQNEILKRFISFSDLFRHIFRLVPDDRHYSGEDIIKIIYSDHELGKFTSRQYRVYLTTINRNLLSGIHNFRRRQSKTINWERVKPGVYKKVSG